MHKKGFSLLELMVALAAASILSLTALKVYGMYYRTFNYLSKDYQEKSAEILKKMNLTNPYCCGKVIKR